MYKLKIYLNTQKVFLRLGFRQRIKYTPDKFTGLIFLSI